MAIQRLRCAQKWDLADAVDQGWTYNRIRAWGQEIVQGEVRLKRHVYAALPVPAAIAAPAQAIIADAIKHAGTQIEAEKQANARHWSISEWRTHLVMGGENKDRPIKCTANAIVPDSGHSPEFRQALRWNEMRQSVTVTRPMPWGEQPEEWMDHHDTAATEWLDRVGLHYQSSSIREAVYRVARDQSYHPVREYLANTLPQWDGRERIANWLTVYCGAPNNPYTQFVGKAMLVSAVARAMRPGCRVKSMIILHGPQDTGKSEVFSILGGRWYGKQNGVISGDSAKAKEQTSKLWLIEMAEVAQIRESNIETFKDFVDTSEDTYRPAYGHRVITIPRCCVFVGTANPDQILHDTTGNVRFWPVKVTCEIDLDGLRRDRDQLWAEAAQAHAADFQFWITDPHLRMLATAEQEARMVDDERCNLVADWLARPEQAFRNQFSMAEIAVGALSLAGDRLETKQQRDMAAMLRRLGMVNRNRTVEGKQRKVWMRAGFQPED